MNTVISYSEAQHLIDVEGISMFYLSVDKEYGEGSSIFFQTNKSAKEDKDLFYVVPNVGDFPYVRSIVKTKDDVQNFVAKKAAQYAKENLVTLGRTVKLRNVTIPQGARLIFSNEGVAYFKGFKVTKREIAMEGKETIRSIKQDFRKLKDTTVFYKCISGGHIMLIDVFYQTFKAVFEIPVPKNSNELSESDFFNYGLPFMMALNADYETTDYVMFGKEFLKTNDVSPLSNCKVYNVQGEPGTLMISFDDTKSDTWLIPVNKKEAESVLEDIYALGGNAYKIDYIKAKLQEDVKVFRETESKPYLNITNDKTVRIG